ncbi:MAG: histidine phosphatase family protein [Ruminococcaceae bacterium]|nr:histidine phosphatase family protein [Oscillospiraceae bacterium]
MSFQAQSVVQVALAQRERNKRGIVLNFDENKGYVFFIRHGQTDWNLKKLLQGRDEIPLNEIGLSQTDEASYALKNAFCRLGLKIDKTFASPLSRAKVTGEKISEALGCPFSTDERLIERDFGEISGKPYTFGSPAILHDVPEIKGLEPTKDVISRVDSFVRENVKIGEKIIAVTHGSVTRVFAEAQKKAPCVDNFDTVLSNCHMVLYSYNGDEIIMEGYNISPSDLDKFI